MTDRIDRRILLTGPFAVAALMRSSPVDAEMPVSPESQARKARSEAILAAENIPFISHLPMLEPVAETAFRPTAKITERALCLAFVSVMGESGDHDLANRLVDEWGVRDHLTPNERAFIGSRAPSQHDRVQFTWRYEALWPLLWSLGFVDALERPDHIIDVPATTGLIVDLGPDQFRAKAHRRDGGEILDALDLTYRYHWAVVDARLHDRPAPGNLEPGVVQERHYALNWLTTYADQEWDDISTDT